MSAIDPPDFGPRYKALERRYTETPGGLSLRSSGGEEGRNLFGYAVVWNSLSQDCGGFLEELSPTCFDATYFNLDKRPDVRLLDSHDSARVLARTSNGTLTLSKDSHGLKFSATPSDTSFARDLIVNIRSKNIFQCSFGFSIDGDTGEEWRQDDKGQYIRRIVKAFLWEISCVGSPAYLDTSVGVRHLERYKQMTPEERDTARRGRELAQREAAARRPTPAYLRQMERDEY